ncbi:MAG TPA: twin-arginine translocation signal domain-containing protein, partial [Casimicrobiaceae bacterium]|nr:twin-arginine translocation signal domain-containing protein [Casimicrobiaceae bacterium]
MGNLVSRREFLKFTGGVAAGAAALPTSAEAASATDAGTAVLPYKAKMVGKAGSLGVNQPVSFTFPDASSPCALLKMGTPV